MVHVRDPCKCKETDQLSDYLQLQQLDKCAPSADADNLALEKLLIKMQIMSKVSQAIILYVDKK